MRVIGVPAHPGGEGRAMMASVQATKHKVVTAILSNRLYQPGSGVWERLYNKLMAMAKDDLYMLDLIIANKMDHANDK